MTDSALKNKALYLSAFATFFIFLFPLLIEISFSDFVREGEYNSRIGWSLIFIFLGLLHKKAWLHAVLLIPFIITGSADIGYAISFGGVFTTATIEAVMQTDLNEASEYATSYASPTLILVLFIYWSVSLWLLSKVNLDVSKTRARTVFLSLGIVLTLVASYRISIMQKYYDTIPGVMGSIPSYYRGHMGVKAETDKRQLLVESIEASNKSFELISEQSQTYVFIIGESLSRHHMGIYGYHRDTTPQLSALTDELNVFQDVISSHAQTKASLSLALTEARVKGDANYREALSIVDLANLAGFKTWWISNQQPLRTTFSAIAAQASETNFISNDFNGVEVRRFDEFLTPYIKAALNDKAGKKAIFIHTMGSHAQYKNRYPESFNRFTDADVVAYTDQPSPRQIDAINTYDNSVLYSDYFAATVLNFLKESPAELKAFTLLSDHGEEVFDKINVKGHSPDNVTANMVDIPFINWLSVGFKQNRAQTTLAIRDNLNKPFMLHDFYHYAAQLMGISSPYNDSEKSLISANFKAPEQRKIYRQVYESDLHYRTTADQVVDRK